VDEGSHSSCDRAQLCDVLDVVAAAHRLFYEGTAAAGAADAALAAMAAALERTNAGGDEP